MKRKNVFAIILVLMVLVCSCGHAESGFGQAVASLPEAYQQVIEAYYNVFYADWYRALTAEDLTQMGISPDVLELDDTQRDAFGCCTYDINGDGIQEIFFGINDDANICPFFQVCTISNGELFTLYVSGDGSMTYLLQDGSLLYENITDSMDADFMVYALNEQNLAVLTFGMIRRSGVCYDYSGGYQGNQMTDEQFMQAAAVYEQSGAQIQYVPIRELYTETSSETAPEAIPGAIGGTLGGTVTETNQPDAGTAADGSAGYFTHQTLYSGGIPVANVLVPQGWTAELSVNWNFVSTLTPGVATVILTSPDGHAIIRLASAEQFTDFNAPLTYPTEGTYSKVYMTYLRYRNAADFQKLTLEMLNCENAELVGEYEVPEYLRQAMSDASELLLQSTYSGASATPLSSEGTVAHRHYRVGDRHLEILTLDVSARGITYGSASKNESVCWYIPADYLLAADSQEDYDLYHPVFQQVAGSSFFTQDFQYVNTTYGEKIREAVHNNILQESYEYIMSDSTGWLTDYHKTTESDAGSWSGGWSDVINEVNTYETTDGGAIKVSTQYDTVYQNGDQIYMGPESQSPEGYGWTKLEIAR